ncbi:MAG: DUF177 domain-containing protein [Alphaproteobacteria bacterium]|nr:DUF177 domain-containing protein [Alphaproteobacteria bacterium]
MDSSTPDGEFPRTVQIDKIPSEGMELDIEAEAKECKALAKRLGIIGLGALRASLRLRHTHGNTMIEVDGSFDAVVTQECVVTLEPVESAITASPVAGLFAPAHLVPPGSGPAEIDSVAEEPEPIGPEGLIDVGELVVQHLALALDPYPRKPGVAFEGMTTDKPERTSPFAKLAELSSKNKS